MFSEVLREEAARRGVAPWPRHHVEPLASLPYDQELALKEAALAAYLRQARLPLRPRVLLPSPTPRGYRSTSKRRVVEREGRLALVVNRDDPARGGFTQSELEPEEHARLFRRLASVLNEPALGRTAARLSWVILRSSAEGTALIFNATRSDQRILTGLARVSREVVAAGLRLAGAYLFVDPSRSDYYLELGSAGGRASLQRLSGPDTLSVRFAGTEFAFHPAVFSQVNPSLVPAMLSEAGRLLGGGDRLWDLYCGYGLFAVALASGGRFASVVGVEASADAIACARANAERMTSTQARPDAGGSRPTAIDFDLREARITGPALKELFAEVPVAAAEALLLDPPYAGAPAPVLLASAGRGARRVLHVTCNTSRIPTDAAVWRRAGYRIADMVPLDMFPGTPELETLVLLEPAGSRAADSTARKR